MVKISYTIAQAVAASSFSRSRIYEHIRSGRLESFKDGGRRHIPADSLHKLIAEMRAGQSGARAA
ncbi:helix-turn-helix domain-containing protein [Streptomyces virginiae]|uniref:helix-turn-helix domain-containing protein n=1 Tax=Streptomyces virginiae TaxID=1961 RepID=UPI00378EB4A2